MIVFVGDKPSKCMKPGARAFEGAKCEARLFEWIREILELPLIELELMETNNSDLIDSYRFFSFNENDWENVLSFGIMNAHSGQFEEYCCVMTSYAVIALGDEAAKKLSEQNIKYFKLPHPSGRNRKLNNKEYIQDELKKAKGYVKMWHSNK